MAHHVRCEACCCVTCHVCAMCGFCAPFVLRTNPGTWLNVLRHHSQAIDCVPVERVEHAHNFVHHLELAWSILARFPEDLCSSACMIEPRLCRSSSVAKEDADAAPEQAQVHRLRRTATTAFGRRRKVSCVDRSADSSRSGARVCDARRGRSHRSRATRGDSRRGNAQSPTAQIRPNWSIRQCALVDFSGGAEATVPHPSS